jgi:hypothetical protein
MGFWPGGNGASRIFTIGASVPVQLKITDLSLING